MKKTILAATIILFALGAHSQTPKAIAPAGLKPAPPCDEALWDHVYVGDRPNFKRRKSV